MTAPLSLRDKQFTYLVGLYGPGLSYTDMLQKYYGGGNSSLTDLLNTAWSGPNSLSDDMYATLPGTGSMTDKQYGSTDGGIATARTNYMTDPRAFDTATDGWMGTRWFGAGGGGNYSYATGVTGLESLNITTARKKTWTVAPTNNGDTGFDIRATATVLFACNPGETITVSGYLRAVTATGVKRFVHSIQFYDGTVAGVSAAVGIRWSGANADTATNVWQRISVTVVVPPGAYGFAALLDVSSAGALNPWGIGDTLEGTGLLIEKSDKLGNFFDGLTPDTVDLDYSWTGTINESTSTEGRSTTGIADVINLCDNPTPGGGNLWGANGTVNTIAYANGVIEVTRIAGAGSPNRAASITRTGFNNPVLKLGVNYQRSVEVWVDAQATLTTNTNGYQGGQILYANMWNKVAQQFSGSGAADFATGMNIDIAGVVDGLHVKLRRAMVAENPTGKELSYCDGNSPGWVWMSTANSSYSYGKPSFAIDPTVQFPAAVHAVWAGDPYWVTGKPADGGLVTTIHNFGSLGAGKDPSNAGGAEQPTYLAKDPAMKNQPSLLFAGTQLLQYDIVDVLVPHWILVICQCSVTTGTLVAFGNGTATSGGVGRANSNNNWFVSASAPAYSGILADTLPHLLLGQVDTNNTLCQVDNVRGTVSTAAVNSDYMLRVGAGGNTVTPASFWVGSVVYVGVFTADPTLDPNWPKVLQFARDCGVAV